MHWIKREWLSKVLSFNAFNDSNCFDRRSADRYTRLASFSCLWILRRRRGGRGGWFSKMKSYPPMAALSALSNADRDCPCVPYKTLAEGNAFELSFAALAVGKASGLARRGRENRSFSPRGESRSPNPSIFPFEIVSICQESSYDFFPRLMRKINVDGRQLCCVHAINSIKIVGSCFFLCFSKRTSWKALLRVFEGTSVWKEVAKGFSNCWKV